MAPRKKFCWENCWLKLIFLILVFCLFLRVVIDPDLGWHLRVGEYIWQNQKIPQTDLFSFTLPNYPYVYHSWLADLWLFLIYKNWGLWGVTLAYSLLGAGILGLVLKTSQLRVKQRWVYAFLLILVPLFSYASTLRVQLFTFLGLALLYYIFRKYLTKPTKLVYLIPFIFLLWVNLHGGFILGLIFWLSLLMIEFLAFAIKEILLLEFSSYYGSSLSLRTSGKLLFVFGLSLVAVLVNPYGFRVYQQAFLMGTNQFAAQFNLDWSPLITSTNITWIFAGLLILASFFIFLFKSRVELREKLLLILYLTLALKLNRFSLALLVVLVPALVVFGQQIKIKLAPFWQNIRLAVFLAVFVMSFVFLGQIIDVCLAMKKAYTDEAAYAQAMPAPYSYPWGAVKYLRQNQVSEKLLNDYNWGGYLIWKLPARKIFIDGRMDNFFAKDKPFAKEYSQIVDLRPGWQDSLNQYQIKAVLLSPWQPLVQALEVSPDWRILYKDKTSTLLEKID